MANRRWLQDYLHFTAKDRLGALIFAAIILGIILWPKISGKQISDAPTAVEADSLLARLPEKNTGYKKEWDNDRPDFKKEAYPQRERAQVSFSKNERFAFDPNSLDEKGWQRLGLQDRTVKTILNYRSKGGKFYKPEDLQRIWGLPDGFYDWVKDYISIERKPFEKNAYEHTKTFEPREGNFEPVAVNASDTSALIALPGIGSKLAYRIVSFRNKLGGFYSVDQIGETYGLHDSVFQKIKPLLQVDAASVKKIKINSATKDELKLHPYIRWNLANAIVEYRNQHGPFKSVDEVKKIELVDEALFEKIRHYLTL